MNQGHRSQTDTEMIYFSDTVNSKLFEVEVDIKFHFQFFLCTLSSQSASTDKVVHPSVRVAAQYLSVYSNQTD